MEDASSVDNLKEMCKENDNSIVECHKQILELQKTLVDHIEIEIKILI